MLDKMGVADAALLDIADRITKMIIEHGGPTLPAFSVTSRLSEDMGIDAIDRMTLACTIEETFDVMISDDAVDAAATVQDLIDAVALAVGEKMADEAGGGEHE